MKIIFRSRNVEILAEDGTVPDANQILGKVITHVDRRFGLADRFEEEVTLTLEDAVPFVKAMFVDGVVK